MTSTMYFAKRTLRLPNGVNREGLLRPGQRVPDKVLAGYSAEQLEELIAKNAIVKGSPYIQPALSPTEHQVTTALSDWAYDPKETEGKSLDELNMKVRDHVVKFGLPTIEPFEDINEARHWLSKDWKPPV